MPKGRFSSVPRPNMRQEGTMKKVLVVVFLLSLAALAYPTEFKIIGGLSLSKSIEPLGPDDVIYLYPPHPLTGAGTIAGGGVEFSLTRNLAIEADVLFFQKGTRIYFELSPVPPGMARINELSIPVLFKLRLKPGTTPYILGGGEFAIVLTHGPNSIDYGLVGGIGLRMQVNKIGLSLEARYHHGLQDLRPEDVVIPSGSTWVRKMRIIAIMLGFSI